MTDQRTYTYHVKAAKDGTTYLVIGETRPVSRQPAPQWMPAFGESVNTFLAGFEKAIRFLGRRA